MKDLIINNRYLINTTEGYKDFEGLAVSSHDTYLEISFTNNETVKCSKEHIFWTYNNDLIKARDLLVGFELKSVNGIFEIKSIKEIKSKKNMIDLIEVHSSDNNFLLSNSLKSHNCQFLTFEKTLINTDILDFYKTAETLEEIMGFEIYKDELEHIDSLLIIVIDPSAGGEDFTVIQLWEIAPHAAFQVGSIADKDMDASLIFEKILWLQDFMKHKWNYNPEDSLLIFERNGIGEGLAQILTQTEKAIDQLEIPIFYDGKGPGVHTTPTSKNKLALQFKNLVEYKKLIINDPKFIEELYGFIRTKSGTYTGKSGYHDDRIMASFLIVYYLMNIFADFAQGDFSVDNMLLINPEDKIKVDVSEEIDPVEQYNKRQKAKKLEEEKKRKEREYFAKQAQMGSSVIEEENDETDADDIDKYDIIGGIV